jgi:acetoin utilization deacetylase AcuC-like enzyme
MAINMTTALYSHPDCKLHEMGSWHPEAPERLSAIEDQLIASQTAPFLEYRSAPLVEIDHILRVHSPEVIERIRSHTPVEYGGTLDHTLTYFELDPDTAINPYSWHAALRAAGAAVAATQAVIDGEIENAFCAIRPPGHHATSTHSMGFCLFNNVAIAARYALDVCGLKRIAIVDFDVHHGNGTEDIFHNDTRALMVSFFQHPLYPYSGADPQGMKPINMVNIPLRAYARGDATREVLQQHWLPALHAHQPEMIFISAGFDAHREDDLAQMGLVESDYAWMTKQIMQIADCYSHGRIVSCLEGGYKLSALARSAVAHIRSLASLA